MFCKQMRHLLHIVLILFLFAATLTVFPGCEEKGRASAVLDHADSLMNYRADSALSFLSSHEAEIGTWPKEKQMRFHLLQIKAQNRAYIPFTSDSLILAVTEYYDKHGTSNEKMEAHYLLGSVYRDIGEAPKAISATHEAVESADTTANDCDYALLSRVYGQLATLLLRVQLPLDAIEAAYSAEAMSIKAGDSIMQLSCQMLRADAYFYTGDMDSMIRICEDASKKYLHYGDTMYSMIALKPAVVGYINKGNLDSAKVTIDKYETLSKWKSNNVVAHSLQNFNAIKAQYYLQQQQFDSAYYYYQRARSVAASPSEKLNVYYGLSKYYAKTGVADSAVKYSELYVSTDDSLFGISVRENFAKMQSLYNYERNMRKAEYAEHKLTELQYRYMIIAILVVMLAALATAFVRKRRERMMREHLELNAMYAESLQRYVDSKKEVDMLKEYRDTDILLIQKLQEERAIDSDTIARLNRKVELKKARIRLYEEELRKQASAIADFQKDKKRPDQWDMEEGLFNLPLISRLHASIAKGKQPGDSQFNAIIELTENMLPAFTAKIRELYPGINRTNMLFCILTKLRFINSERAVALNMSSQAVTNRCAFLYNKFTGKKGGAGDFDEIIQKIG